MQIVTRFTLTCILIWWVTGTDSICDLISFLTFLVKKCCTESWSPGQQSGPSPAGGKASAEGEVDFRVLIFSPGAKRHYDGRTVILSAILDRLFSHCMGSFVGIMALIDKVTDLLTIHHEVDSVCGEDQEAVISMVQLDPLCFWLGYHSAGFEI